METYYRKRSKKAHQTITMEMDQRHQKEAEQGSITAAGSPFLGRLPHVPPPLSSDHSTHLLKEPVDDGGRTQMQNHIKPGFLYEIDHTQLPTRTPVQFKSIRVAMVCEKTDMNVSVRFPSMESLVAFFRYSARETHPALDDKFIMGSALAARVLTRLVPPEVFSEQKNLQGFWLISSSSARSIKDSVNTTDNKKGNSLSEALKGNGSMRWGVRRQVKYLGRHKDSDGNDVYAQNSSSSFVNGVEGSQMELGVRCNRMASLVEEEKNEDADDDGGERDVDSEMKDEGEDEEEEDGDDEEKGEEEEEEDDDDDDDDDDEEEEEEEGEEEKVNLTNQKLKRKRYPLRNNGIKKPKKEKVDIRKQKLRQKKNYQTKKKKNRVRCKEALSLRNPKDRWSSERYKLAEQNLLAVMKSKGATADKPVLRPQLRAEARKKIGDTGLLDHLLKHMAGRLAPGGQERFRRRHNPDGAMEYWLESADLVSIRKDAGVTDPYWVPPPGWKLGDSPTQDPICARELKVLKDDISKMKRDVELMATKMQLEEEVGKLRREIDELSSKKRQEDQAITVAPSRSDISQKLDQLVTSLDSSKCDFGNPNVSVERYKEQLIAISDFVKEIEERIGKITPNEEERAKTGASLIAPSDVHVKEKRESKSKQQEVQALMAAATEGEGETSKMGKDQIKGQNAANTETEKTTAAEAKAARLQRLKSGFRICKPQGTFLWPNMVKDNNSSINSSSSKINSPQVVVQVEVPTPPSVNSSTPPQLPYHHHHPHSASLVKPLAEKRAVTVTVSTVSKGLNYEDGSNNYSTTTTALINLNDAPTNHNAMSLLSPTANTTLWESAIYGTRNVFGYDQKEYNACSCSSVASMPSEVGNWLALSTPKSATDESSHG